MCRWAKYMRIGLKVNLRRVNKLRRLKKQETKAVNPTVTERVMLNCQNLVKLF